MKLFIAGESHVSALQQGRKLLESKAEWPQSVSLTIRPMGGGHILPTPFFVDRGDYLEITHPEFRENIKQLPPMESQGGFDYFGFSAGLHCARVWRHKDWRQVVLPGASGSGMPVSSSLMNRIFDDDVKYIKQMLEALQRMGKKIFVVEAPYPFRHHKAVMDGSPSLISTLDRLSRMRMRAWLAERNIPVIAVPAQCIDAEGFMLDCYRSETPDDAHHANAQFGALIMKDMLTFFSGKES